MFLIQFVAAFIAVLLACLPSAVSQPDYTIAWREQSQTGFSCANEIRDLKHSKTIGIVACEVDQGLVCFSVEGQRLWAVAMRPPVTAAPAVADLNDDGLEDVVACDGNGGIFLFDSEGRELWRSVTGARVQAESCPVIEDLNGDGNLEIVVGDNSGGVYAFSSSGQTLWTFHAKGDQMGIPLIADIYDTPGREIIITSHNGHIYALNANGEWLWQICHAKECLPWAIPVYADIRGDGYPEIFIGGGLHHFIRIDPAKPAVTLDENVYLHVNTAILCADLENDGKDEVVFGNKGGKVYCYGENGFRWIHEFNDTNVSCSPLALNLDEDPSLEVMLTYHGMKILNADGTVFKESAAPMYGSQPLAGDFDQDGKLDLALCGNGLGGEHGIACLKWDLPFKENPWQWKTVAGDRTHSRKHPRAASFKQRPCPSLEGLSGMGSFKPLSELRLVGGANDWRFDVENPRLGQFVLLLEIVPPDGCSQRFSNHVFGEKEQTSFRFEVSLPGPYQVKTTLVDAGSMKLIAEERLNLEYGGAASDITHASELLDRIQDSLRAWKQTNPGAAGHFEMQALSLVSMLSDSTVNTEKANQILNQALRIETIVQTGQALAPSQSFAAVHFSPWAFFDPAQTLPNAADAARKLTVSLCRNEYDSQSLVLANYSPTTLNVRVWADDFQGGSAAPAGEILQFRRALLSPTIRNEMVSDALPKLDQASILPVSQGETAQLWLTFHANELTAGKYTSNLHLKSVEPNSTHLVIPIEMEVFDLEMPHPSPLKFCVWSSAQAPDYALQDLVEHGVNVFVTSGPTGVCNEKGELTGPLAFEAHDALVKRLSPHGMLLFISPQGGLSGQPFLSEPWKRGFVAFLRQWVAHLKELGLGYEDFALYPYDEPSGPYSQTSINLAHVARVVREADPEILIYTDPTSGTTKESLKMWEGLIDIWCPSAELLERFSEEILPFAKKHGKQVWFYDASGRSRTLSCLGIYTWRFWYAWNLGLTGAGWWTYDTKDYLWDGPNPDGDYFYHVYSAPGAVVTSKRWEASREGKEDYEILFLLKQAIENAASRGATEEHLKEAKALLEDIPSRMESILHGAGRRIPLENSGVALYRGIDETLRQARRQIAETAMRVNAMRP